MRCFYNDDCADAKKQLGPAVHAAVATVLTDDREPRIEDLHTWPAEKKPGRELLRSGTARQILNTSISARQLEAKAGNATSCPEPLLLPS